MKNEIKYQYAIDYDNNAIVNINSINEKNRKNDYRCISCKKKLFPRLGKIKVHHFAHAKECNCNPETYLHNLAKLSLYNNLKNRLEKRDPLIFYSYYYNECNITINCSCRELFEKKELNLFDYYSKVCLETNIDDFVPDVCLCGLKNENIGPIFFEIYVTHSCEPSKIFSGNRIIEFEVCDENDAIKLGQLNSIDIYSSNYKLKSYNFKEHYKKENLSKTCNKIKYFVLFHSGMVLTLDSKSFERCNKKNIAFSTHSCICEGTTFKKFLVSCLKKSIIVKSCYLCKYRNSYYEDCVCNLRGKTKKQCGGHFSEKDIAEKKVKQSMAVKCGKYRIDEFYTKFYNDTQDW